MVWHGRSVGGDTLQIEVNVMPGKGEIILTGQLGDVMKESAQAGISYIRSISSKYKVAEDFFEKHDIHIHIPEGAVPKDRTFSRHYDGDCDALCNYRQESACRSCHDG